MQTEIISIHQTGAIEQGAELIASGQLIAFPTDTVYGIGACAFNSQAVDKIYQAKGRSQLKAIPILLADIEDLGSITPPLSLTAERLVRKFWPGPLTLVLPLLPSLPAILSPTPTIGLRIPDHQPARQLLRQTGPLAATSANLSGNPPALTAKQVDAQLSGSVNLILDGGISPGGHSSTVVDCSKESPTLLREGPLSWDLILDFLKSSP